MAASVAQLVEHRSRKAGVTGSSPVAGSIAQDSRLRAAFLLPISDAHPPIQAQRRRQLPYTTKSPATFDLNRARPSFRGGGRYVRVPSYDRRSSSGDHSGHFGLG